MENCNCGKGFGENKITFGMRYIAENSNENIKEGTPVLVEFYGKTFLPDRMFELFTFENAHAVSFRCAGQLEDYIFGVNFVLDKKWAREKIRGLEREATRLRSSYGLSD